MSKPTGDGGEKKKARRIRAPKVQPPTEDVVVREEVAAHESLAKVDPSLAAELKPASAVEAAAVEALIRETALPAPPSVPVNRLAPPTLRIVPPRRKMVAIVGFTEHRLLAPFDNPEVECWGLNELYRYMPAAKFHRWFEIHDQSDFTQEGPNKDVEHIKGLAALNMPVYTNSPWPELPTGQVLPKAFIEQACGTTYFTSSIAWMIGLAIAEGFEKIGIFGVDMAQDTEYQEQRPCCEFLIGLARGRGIQVYLPPTSDLLKSVGQYGFGAEATAYSMKLTERMGWLGRELKTNQDKLAQLEGEYVKITGQYHEHKTAIGTNIAQIQGAFDDCRYWQRSWGVKMGLQPGQRGNPLERAGLTKLVTEQGPDGKVPTMEAAQV